MSYCQLSEKEGYRIFKFHNERFKRYSKKKIQEIINNTENVPILADNIIGANIVRKFDWRENKILSCIYWYFHENEIYSYW